MVICASSTADAGPLTGSWSVLTPMNTARTSAFVAAIDGKLYVAGGHDGSGATTVLERYDPGTDTWTTLASMPSRRYQGGVAALGTDLYVIGGWNFPDSTIPTSTVQIYDTLTDTWSSGPSMPILSSSGPTGVIDGKIYKHTAEHGFSSASRQLHVLDPVAGTWTALASLPNDHAGGAAGVIDDIFYVAAGTDFGFGSGGGIHAQLHAYDPGTNTWSTLASAPTARAGVAGGVYAGHLLVAGGSDGSSSLNVFEVYDPLSNTWLTLPSMPFAVSGGGGAVIGDTFYVVGGDSNTLQAFNFEVVPEPSSLALLMLGSIGVCGYGLRRRFAREKSDADPDRG